jgi:hypothetical protein
MPDLSLTHSLSGRYLAQADGVFFSAMPLRDEGNNS